MLPARTTIQIRGYLVIWFCGLCTVNPCYSSNRETQVVLRGNRRTAQSVLPKQQYKSPRRDEGSLQIPILCRATALCLPGTGSLWRPRSNSSFRPAHCVYLCYFIMHVDSRYPIRHNVSSWRERRACCEFLNRDHRLSPLPQNGRDNAQLFTQPRTLRIRQKNSFNFSTVGQNRTGDLWMGWLRRARTPVPAAVAHPQLRIG